MDASEEYQIVYEKTLRHMDRVGEMFKQDYEAAEAYFYPRCKHCGGIDSRVKSARVYPYSDFKPRGDA